jgi:hypothetical protein
MNFFEDILVIINFNHPYYKNIPFLKEIYKCFPNLIFYGDDLPGYSQPGVLTCKQDSGRFAYRVMLDAIDRFPGHSGYLFFMDDVLLNYWTLEKRDKNKIWFVPFYPNSPTDVIHSDRRDWWWAHKTWGLEACKNSWLEFPAKFKENLEAQHGLRNAFIGGESDFFYLPRRLINDFREVFKVMSKNEVYLEIAVPTGLSALEDYREWEMLSVKSLWGEKLLSLMSRTGDRIRWRHFYSNDINGLHPIKFSRQEDRDTVRWLFDNAHNTDMLRMYLSLRGIKELWLRFKFDLFAFMGKIIIRVAYLLRINKAYNKIRNLLKNEESDMESK